MNYDRCCHVSETHNDLWITDSGIGVYPIHSGKLEGVNNKIKVIERKAYGYHDRRYFSLKIIQAFTS